MKRNNSHACDQTRREFLARALTVGGLVATNGPLAVLASGCVEAGVTTPSPDPDASLGFSARTNVPHSFFGHMLQGGLLRYDPPDGTFLDPSVEDVLITIGTLRAWDGGWMWGIIGDGSTRMVIPPDQYAASDYYWNGVDSFLNLCQRRGYVPMYCFGGHGNIPIPNSAKLYPGTDWPYPNMTAWMDFIDRLLTRAAGRFKVFEMWNEGPNDWNPNQTASHLYDLSRAGYDMIKARVPGATVLTPSFNDMDTFGAPAAIQYFDVMQQRNHPAADGIAFHSYKNVLTDYNTIKGIASERGFGSLSIWLTECGGPDSSQILSSMASVGVSCVIFNASIAEYDDHDKRTTLGQRWEQAYSELTSAPVTPHQLSMQGASGGRGRARWTNASYASPIEVQFYSREGSAPYTLTMSTTEPAGTIFTPYYYFGVGTQVYFRARYTNAVQWSPNSNVVLLH